MSKFLVLLVVIALDGLWFDYEHDYDYVYDYDYDENHIPII